MRHLPEGGCLQITLKSKNPPRATGVDSQREFPTSDESFFFTWVTVEYVGWILGFRCLKVGREI